MPFKDPEARKRWEAAHPQRKVDRHRKAGRVRMLQARARREFVAVDGEGAYAEGDPEQRYVLLSDSLGRSRWRDEGLSTRECLEFLLCIPRVLDGVRVVVVGFGLDYDVNFWLADLPPEKWERLYGKWHVCYWGPYRIRYLKGKWFEVWKVEGPNRGAYARVDDVHSLFHGKFVSVVRQFLGADAVSPLLAEGKVRRVRFSLADREEITRYNAEENRLLVEVMRRFQASLDSLGMRPAHYSSPAVLGKWDLSQHLAKEFIPRPEEEPPEIRDLYARAFFGGRIEVADVGHAHRAVEEWDRNSSYPATESTLPNLKAGRWVRVVSEEAPIPFALYHVQWDFRKVPRRYYPFPFRDAKGWVYFPPSGTAWLWGIEVLAGVLYGNFPAGSIRILDGWEFKYGWESKEPEAGSAWKDRVVTNTWMWSDDFATWPAGGEDVVCYSPNSRPAPNDHPFSWVEDRYRQRLGLKKKGDPAEYPLKISMNSHYGSFAQQLFLDPTNPSRFAHLGLAGFITASTRAALYRMARLAGEERVIGFATDGLLVLASDSSHPRPLDSKRLGGWKVTTYRDLVSVQAGVRRARHREGCGCGKCDDQGWETFGRGFGGVEVPFDLIERGWAEHAPSVSYPGRDSFVGHRLAAARHRPDSWRRWEPKPRTIQLGTAGTKRNPLPRPELIDPSQGLVETHPNSFVTTPGDESAPYRFKRARALTEIDQDAETELEDGP